VGAGLVADGVRVVILPAAGLTRSVFLLLRRRYAASDITTTAASITIIINFFK